MISYWLATWSTSIVEYSITGSNYRTDTYLFMLVCAYLCNNNDVDYSLNNMKIYLFKDKCCIYLDLKSNKLDNNLRATVLANNGSRMHITLNMISPWLVASL